MLNISIALLVPVILVTLLVELRRRKLATEDLSPAVSRMAVFEYSLTIWFVLVILIVLGLVSQQAIWMFWESLSQAVCETPTSHRLLGQYGCSQLVNILSILSTPWITAAALAGLSAALPIYWPGWQGVSRRGRLLLGIGLAVLAGAILLSTTREMFIFSGLPGIWLLLTWNLPGHGRWGKAARLLVGLFLAALAWMYLYLPAAFYSQDMQGLALVTNLGLMVLFPLTTGLMMAAALRAVLDPEPDLSARRRRAVLQAWTAAALLAFTLYLLYLENLWDIATDGMGTLFIVIFCLVGCFAGAMLAAWTLPGRRKLAPLALSIVLLLLMTQVREQLWRTSPALATADWGSRIGQAIQNYHARSGRYPAALNDLVPFDIWRIQRPFVFKDEEWCYEAGADYYRLGYVNRPAFGVPAQYLSINVVSAEGEPPAGPWSCDAVLQRKQQSAPLPHGG